MTLTINLADLTDVDPANKADGRVPVWRSASSKHEYETPSGGGGSQNVFSTIAVSGQSSVVADSPTDILTLAAGNGIALATNSTTDTVTFTPDVTLGTNQFTDEQGININIATGSPTGHLRFIRQGASYAQLGLDSQNRLRLAGANLSGGVLIDDLNRMVIGTHPGNSTMMPMLYTENDTWVGGNLRVGRPDSFQGSELTVSSMTRSGSTVTVTTSSAHGLTTGHNVYISGATQADYNTVAPNVIVTSSTVFTWTIAGTPATPATGTIKCRQTLLFDPNGCVTVGHDQSAQPLAYRRYARQKAYYHRDGLNASDNYTIFTGDSNTTALSVDKTTGNIGIGVDSAATVVEAVRSGNSGFHITMKNTGSGGAADSGFKAVCNTTNAQFSANDGNSYFGTTSNHQSRFYANLTLGMIIGTAGEAYFPNIGTTASAANCFLNSADSNKVLRSTSARKYKTDIRELSDDEAMNLLSLRPVAYKSVAEADDKDQEHIGLIAEDVAEIDPRLVHWAYDDDQYCDGVLKDGAVKTPQGVQYERISVALIVLLRKLLDKE